MHRLAMALCAALLPGLAHAGPAASCDTPQAEVARAPTPSFDGVRVGVALGSGSLHGMAHIGVLSALEESGLEVSVVAGTSAGALVGSLWASGMSASQIEALATRESWDDMASFSPGRDGLFSSATMRARLRKAFAGRPIESWPRRFGAVATNLENGHRRLLAAGDGALAVVASSSIPAFFSPVVVSGEKLGDGSLVEPVPVEAARDLGADYVIAVDVAYRPYEEATGGITGMAFQAMHILTNSLGERLARSADVAIRLDVHRALMDCGTAGAIEAGRETMRRALPGIVAEVARRSAAARGTFDAHQKGAPALVDTGIPPEGERP